MIGSFGCDKCQRFARVRDSISEYTCQFSEVIPVPDTRLAREELSEYPAGQWQSTRSKSEYLIKKRITKNFLCKYAFLSKIYYLTFYLSVPRLSEYSLPLPEYPCKSQLHSREPNTIYARTKIYTRPRELFRAHLRCILGLKDVHIFYQYYLTSFHIDVSST